MAWPAVTITAVGNNSENSYNTIAAKTVAQNLGGYFSPSLHARENSEAILMPAIVVQQLLDDSATELSGYTMEFDSVIEVSNSADSSPLFAFAHYIVGKNSYKIVIMSANPELGKINLTVPARGLSFESNSKTFSISHLYYTNLNHSFTRPFGVPPPFEFMYGDYQLSQLRYTDRDALYRRKIISEIRGAYRLQTVTNRSKMCEQVLTNSGSRYSAVAKFNNGKLKMLEMFSDSGALDEHVEYEYAGTSNKSLTAETIVFPETTIVAGFQGGKNIRVNINDKACEVKTFPLTFRRGGRVVKIKYGATNCDRLNLKSIEVVCQTNGLGKVNIQVNNFNYKASE